MANEVPEVGNENVFESESLTCNVCHRKSSTYKGRSSPPYFRRLKEGEPCPWANCVGTIARAINSLSKEAEDKLVVWDEAIRIAKSTHTDYECPEWNMPVGEVVARLEAAKALATARADKDQEVGEGI